MSSAHNNLQTKRKKKENRSYTTKNVSAFENLVHTIFNRSSSIISPKRLKPLHIILKLSLLNPHMVFFLDKTDEINFKKWLKYSNKINGINERMFKTFRDIDEINEKINTIFR